MDNIKIVNCDIGMEIQVGRGGVISKINAGGCNTGIINKTTDCIFVDCISCMNQYDGFINVYSNNNFINCKAFCCGLSKKYGSGFKNQGSYNRFMNCESQQNVFENFNNQSGTSNIINLVSDGAGYKSLEYFPSMSYQENGEGDFIPISNIRLYNSKNNIIDVTIVNGRLESYAKIGLYCQYGLSDKNNIINITTNNIDTSKTFIDYQIDGFDTYVENNKVTVNSKELIKTTFSTPSITDSNVEITSGGYIKNKNIVFISVTVKVLKTTSYATEILNSLPKPLSYVSLSCYGASKLVRINNESKIVVSPGLTEGETFTITGMYLTNS